MADAVTSQTLLDGPRNVVMKFTNLSDGTGESAVTKVDVSALGGSPGEVKINRVKFTTQGMAVRMLWDATTDELIMDLPADRSGMLDFTNTGGLINNAGAGVTGDIRFTTIGHTAGDSYMVELEMVKK